MNVIAGRRKNFVYNNYARVSTDAGWKQNERRRKTRVVVRPRVLGTVQRTVSPQPKLYFSRARPSISNRYLSIAREKGDKRWLALLERNGAEKERLSVTLCPRQLIFNSSLLGTSIAFRVQLYREMSPSRTGTHLFSQSRHWLTGISLISVSMRFFLLFSQVSFSISFDTNDFFFFFCYYRYCDLRNCRINCANESVWSEGLI